MNLGGLIFLALFCIIEGLTTPSPFMGDKVTEHCNRPSSSSSLRMASNDAPDLISSLRWKIFLMIEPTPFTHVSGYSNRYKEMLKFLDKAGDSVDILTVDSKTPAKDLPNKFLNYTIEHTQGFTFPLYNQISLTVDLPQMKGFKIINDQKPDLIHVTSPGFVLFPAIMYARLLQIPLVLAYHTHLPTYGKNYLGFIPKIEEFAWMLLRLVHNRADLTLCTSAPLQKELIENGIERVEVWRKGIDTVRFDPKYCSVEMRKEMSDGNPDDFLMVYVGRLGAEKRLKDIKPMLEKMPNARLCIVGKGPHEEELKKWFKGTKTVFTGQLGGDKLSSAFASADVFVMPSDSETLGFVVLESMASGVPVVAANAGGIPDIIDDGKTSFLVEPGDTEGFVKRLNELSDPEFRKELGIKARAEAERWGWEAATSVLRNIQYQQALRNFRTRSYTPEKLKKSRVLMRLQSRFKRLLAFFFKLIGKEMKSSPATVK